MASLPPADRCEYAQMHIQNKPIHKLAKSKHTHAHAAVSLQLNPWVCLLHSQIQTCRISRGAQPYYFYSATHIHTGITITSKVSDLPQTSWLGEERHKRTNAPSLTGIFLFSPPHCTMCTCTSPSPAKSALIYDSPSLCLHKLVLISYMNTVCVSECVSVFVCVGVWCMT